MFDVGQLVRIRERTWQVLEDHASHSGSDHILRVRGIEGEWRGEDLTFIYRPVAQQDGEHEEEDLGIEKVEALPVPELLWRPNTPPSQWERLHTAYQLSIAHHTNYLPGLAGSRLEIEPYQLAPVLQVMSAPQQRFLLAEDVGMGKTIEAGLIMMELIARGRGDRILIVVPAALQDQWQDELQDKFGLTDFKILDNEYLTKDLLPTLPPGANPWHYANRVITSIDFAKQERIQRALKKTRWDLVIVDEAHYLAESGTDSNPVKTDRSRFGEMLAPQCESFLLLTATPHNGYSQGFYSLLRLLDDTRFASAADMKREAIRQVVIRRSKQQIFNEDGSPKFHKRTVKHIELSLTEPAMTDMRKLYSLLNRYVARHWKKVRNNPNERATVGFALTLLKKRFSSSIEAFRKSLETRLQGLTNETMAPDAGHGLLRSYQLGVELTEAQRERVERQVIVCTTEREQQQLAEELRYLERMLELARKIGHDKDYKASQLKSMIDDFQQQGRKVIVFTEYKDTLDYLHDYLRTHGYEGRIALMHGHLNRRERNHQEIFFHLPETAMLLATDAASEGLNFQHDCWTVIHNELPWNPNRLEQRNGRVDRWGQRHKVEVYNMILADTLEGDILLRLQKKLEKIRNDLGNASDVLSVVGTLNDKQKFDTLLMDGTEQYDQANEQEEAEQAVVDEVDEEIEEELRKGREALDACRADFLIAPGTFGRAEYVDVARAEAQTEHALPSLTALEQFVLDSLPPLGGSATPVEGQTRLWTLEIPASLQRTGVHAHYEQATFERKTALADKERPPTIEFIAPGHPLLQALIAVVKSDARSGSGLLTGRMSQRVVPGVPHGFLFTYLGRWQDQRGAVAAEEIVPIFVGLDGTTLSPTETSRLLEQKPLRKNAPATLLTEAYEPCWIQSRERALTLASYYCQARAEAIVQERRPQLEILRRDIEVWQEARLRWVERALTRRFQETTQLALFEEKEERDRRRALQAAETRRQNDLQHEKKLIQMRRERREAEIAAMVQIHMVQPEAIGALVIVPAEEC